MGNAQNSQAIKAEIKFAKASYYPGEIVRGVVLLQIAAHRVQMRSAHIIVRGRERSQWVEKSLTGPPVVKQGQWLKRLLFECTAEIPLSGCIARGVYAIPFEFQLPEALPPTVDVRGYASNAHSFGGCVKYTVKAMCDINGTTATTPTSHFTCKEQFKIAQPRARNTGAFKETAEDTPKWLGIMGTGRISCSVGIDRIDCTPGDSLNIFCEIQNDTSVAVRQIKVRLWRDVFIMNRISTPCVVRHRLESVHHTEVIPAFGKREGDTGVFIPVKLPSTVDPEMRSESVHVSYRLVLSLDLPFTPDLCVDIPISVYHPQPNRSLPEVPVAVPRNATILSKVSIDLGTIMAPSGVASPSITLNAPNGNTYREVGVNNIGLNPHYIPSLPTNALSNSPRPASDTHQFVSTPAPYAPAYPAPSSAYLTPRSPQSAIGNDSFVVDYHVVDHDQTSQFGGLVPTAPPAPV